MQNLSIILPVKNGQNYLNQSLRDIRSNICSGDEVLVINDGSTDLTAKMLQSELPNFPQLRVLQNRGSGLVDALNLGLNECSNDWIARFDVDDRYSKDRLENQKKYISTTTAAIFSDYSIWSDSERFLGFVPSPILSVPTGISLLQSQRTAHPSVLMNKNAVLSVGGYREADFPAEDLSLWLRLLRVGKLVSCPKELLLYRQASSSVSGSLYKVAKTKSNFLLREIGLPEGYLNKALREFEETMEFYSQVSLSEYRCILHLKELYQGIKVIGCSTTEKKDFLKNATRFFSYIHSYSSGTNLMFWKVVRKLNRII